MTRLSARDRTLAVAAVILVAVLVGMSTHGAVGSGAGLVPVAPVVVLLQTLFWLVIAADVLVMVVIVHALFTERRNFLMGGRRRSLLVYLAALMPAAIAAVAILYLPPRSLARLPTLAGLLGGANGRLQNAHRHATASTGADVMWISLLLAGLIIVLFVGWFFWGGTKRPAGREHESAAPHVAVVEALEESMDALRAITDPRRAIIAAYSAMERAMSRAGMARRPAEAPTEFLARVLRSALDVSLDARRLTYLFEVAKFSDHGVDETMRADALSALARIRDQVAAATPT
jgi:uncharacterized protein DUF4129